MAYRVQTDDVFVDAYRAICGVVRDDAHIASLAKETGLIFDFDLDTTPVTSPQPRNTPRIYLLPVSNQCELNSTCTHLLTLEYTIVIDGFHFRNAQVYRLAYRLLYLLRNFPLAKIRIDEDDFTVVCNPGTGSYDYDASSQLIQYNIGFSFLIYV